MLLGIMPERAISDLECLCRARSDPIGLLERRLQITALRIGLFLLEIDPLCGYVQPPTGDGGCANAGVSGNTIWQHGKRYFRAALQRHSTLHSVFQFADIAGPIVELELPHGLWRDCVNRLFHDLAKALKKMAGKQRNVLAAFA